MSTVREDLSAQVDGVTDTFTTLNNISVGIVPDLNGQLVNIGDITILSTTSFKLGFVPKLNDTLSVLFNPDRFDITSQIDGVKNIFVRAASDLETGEFVAIQNGLFISGTVTIDQNRFSVPSPPVIGDTLAYIRVINTECDQRDQEGIGIVQELKLRGTISLETMYKGILSEEKLSGVSEQQIDMIGIVEEPSKLIGIAKME